MITYNGNLIVAGGFDSIGGIAANNIAKWDGSSWSALGSGLSIDTAHSLDIDIEALAIYNGDLYVAGQFDTANGVPVNNIAKWNGSSWSPVGSGIPEIGMQVNVNTVRALAVYNGFLYAAGLFDTAGGIQANGIAKWDGTQWTSVDSGVLGYILCLTVYNGELYAGGHFIKAGNTKANNIAVWNDTLWATLDNGIDSGLNATMTSIAFYQGNLYAVMSGYIPHYADSLEEWNGTGWSSISNSIPNNYSLGIDVLYSFNGNLIIGGGFDSIGGATIKNLAQWNGNTWSSFGGSVNEYSVQAITTYNGYLYAGGQFTQAGNDSANSIAEYTCATDGIHEVTADHVHVYPNPTTGMVNISIDNAEAGLSVQIYDLLGQKIFQSSISSDNTSIDLSGHAAGSYLYHISGASGEDISAGMIIIQ